jgi:hypothetical protein
MCTALVLLHTCGQQSSGALSRCMSASQQLTRHPGKVVRAAGAHCLAPQQQRRGLCGCLLHSSPQIPCAQWCWTAGHRLLVVARWHPGNTLLTTATAALCRHLQSQPGVLAAPSAGQGSSWRPGSGLGLGSMLRSAVSSPVLQAGRQAAATWAQVLLQPGC